MVTRRGFIGLGSNLGDPRTEILEALRLLAEQGVEVERVSSLYRTEPVEAPAQPWFLNGVARVRSSLEPLEMLGTCQAIETARGRRHEGRHLPRTIDLDILLWGEVHVESPLLTLPHRSLHLRRFVLVPLAEIAPEVVPPNLGLTVVELLARCPDRSEVVRVESSPLC